jgi:hypothetical protein
MPKSIDTEASLRVQGFRLTRLITYPDASVANCECAPMAFRTIDDRLITCLLGDRAVPPAYALSPGGKAVSSSVNVLGTLVFRLQREACIKENVIYAGICAIQRIAWRTPLQSAFRGVRGLGKDL